MGELFNRGGRKGGADAHFADLFMTTPAHTDTNNFHWVDGIRRFDYTVAWRSLRPDQIVNDRGAGGMTALHVAAEAGKLYVVKRLVRSRADVNAIDDAGRTPLMVAQFYMRLDIADYLIRHLHLIRATTKYVIERWPDRTPSPHRLHMALFEWNLYEVRSNTRTQITIDGDQLVSAARVGDLATVRSLVGGGDIHIDSLDSKTKETAFSAALARGRLIICDYLRKHGADVNGQCIVNGKAQAALVTAVLGGNVLVVKQLLADGVSLLTTHINNSTCALAEAVKSGSSEMIDVLLDAGVRFLPPNGSNYFASSVYHAMHGYGLPTKNITIWQRLQIACWQQDLARVKQLFHTHRELQDPDAMATNGANALFLAVYQQNDDIVDELLRRGAAINAPGALGVTAMVAAVYVNSLRMLRRLVDQGGDLTTVHVNINGAHINADIMSLLATAIHAGATECTHFLLATEIRPEHLDHALKLAVRRGDVDVVRLLLDNALPLTGDTLQYCCTETRCPVMLDLLLTRCCHEGYSINCESITQAVMMVSIRGDVDLLCVFLTHGVDVNARYVRQDLSRRDVIATLLLHIAELGHRIDPLPELVEQVIDGGADLSAVDENGHTALQIVEKKITYTLGSSLREKLKATRDILQGYNRCSASVAQRC